MSIIINRCLLFIKHKLNYLTQNNLNILQVMCVFLRVFFYFVFTVNSLRQEDGLNLPELVLVLQPESYLYILKHNFFKISQFRNNRQSCSSASLKQKVNRYKSKLNSVIFWVFSVTSIKVLKIKLALPPLVQIPNNIFYYSF